MQTTGGFVVVAVELAAGMQYGQHGFKCRFFRLGVLVDRDAATVVTDGYRFPILVQLQRDLGRVPVHGFVDRVVHDLPDQVMQAGGPDTADVHSGAFANGFESLKDYDIVALVFFSHVYFFSGFSSPGDSTGGTITLEILPFF